MTDRYVGKRALRPRESAGGPVRAEFKEEHRRECPGRVQEPKKKREKVRKSTQESAPKAQGECHRVRESAGGPGRLPEIQEEWRPGESGDPRKAAREERVQTQRDS